MKIQIYPKLRAALLAVILSASGITALSTAQAVAIADNEEDLTSTTLTELHKLNPTLYPKESSYQLEKVTDLNPAGDVSIFKYLYDTTEGTYTPVQYNVVFSKPLGDQKPDSAEYVHFGIYQIPFLPLWFVDEVQNESSRYLSAYSTNSSRLEHSSGTLDVKYSFVGLENMVAGQTEAFGGALNNNATIGNLTGDFVANLVTAFRFSGDELEKANGGALYNNGTITTIRGGFIGNSANGNLKSRGGALFNNDTIITIAGDFMFNSADNQDEMMGGLSLASGGALYNDGAISTITGDFISNTAANSAHFGGTVVVGDARGGALCNHGAISTITGDFISNSAYNELSGLGGGGAIFNEGTIATITGDFIANSVISRYITLGGAIYNHGVGLEVSTIGFLALDRSMYFTGNFISEDEGVTKIYEAVYNKGKLHFNAYGDNSIIMNDGINGNDREVYRGAIAINNGLDGAGADIDAKGKAFSVVAFNSFVNGQNVALHAGELLLGEYAGQGVAGSDNYIPTTQAALNNSSVTINAGALVSVQGQLQLDDASTIKASAAGVAGGSSRIRGLAADSSISGGSIEVVDNSRMSVEDLSLSSSTINIGGNASLSLQNITFKASEEGEAGEINHIRGLAANSSISGGSIEVADNSHLIIESLTLTSLAINMGTTASLSLQNITLVYDRVSDNRLINLTREAASLHYTLAGIDVQTAAMQEHLTLDVTMLESQFATFDTTLQSEQGVLFTVAGLQDATMTAGLEVSFDINGRIYTADYLTSTVDGAQFIITGEKIIPEPSTATLSLLALTGLLARRRRKSS